MLVFSLGMYAIAIVSPILASKNIHKTDFKIINKTEKELPITDTCDMDPKYILNNDSIVGLTTEEYDFLLDKHAMAKY